jgi:hypothetical protein
MVLLLAGLVPMAGACGCNGGPAPFEGQPSGPEPFVSSVERAANPGRAMNGEPLNLKFDHADGAGTISYISLVAGVQLPPRDVEALASATYSVEATVAPEHLPKLLDAMLSCHRFRIDADGGGPRLIPTEVGTLRTHDACDVRSVPVAGDAAALAHQLLPRVSPRGSVFAAGSTLVVVDVPDALNTLIARLRQLDVSSTDADLR